MTKYEEICAAYGSARKAFSENQAQCLKFAAELVKGMIDYFGCKEQHIKIYPPDINFDPANAGTVEQALRMAPDGVWYFVLGITLYQTPENPPAETLCMNLAVSSTPAGFEIKVKDVREPFHIPPDYSGITRRHKAFYELVYRTVKNTYEKGLMPFSTKTEIGRDIAF
ncbi:hypothetical protein CH330_03335 [candidate division WOR-3 bacterium JGI_Cruoil_03_51_56]|uniref:Uncharacterized protein n=1 Tax=candidate division WOR-3 bacterium JGI_Cruoil_03_51_56 TaxID=1973747 RepID=A0A235BSJ3_UNCW3|nr:MAG: hypothetical protein CH330_07910 [candidate division WOR-3 bacterium JGI_Cruoil_03_51_56]OYD16258.1 MAG: hypothetical protein CH330_03335 [candidate division WOR-3 bacterium JGI_Cruoil_03_51_56]